MPHRLRLENGQGTNVRISLSAAFLSIIPQWNVVILLIAIGNGLCGSVSS